MRKFAVKNYYYLLLFIAFFVWNYWQPLTADDYIYAFNNSFSNATIISDLTTRYFHWSGRLSADFLVLFFLNQQTLNFQIIIIDFISALSILVSVHCICSLLYGKNYRHDQLLICTSLYILFFGLAKTFAQDFLWKTVAIQYSWGFALVLYLIIQNLKYIAYPILIKRLPYKFFVGFSLIAGIFIGFYNEIYFAVVISLFGSLLITFLVFKISLSNLTRLSVGTFVVATLVSGIASVIAPGNFIRRGTYLVNLAISVKSYNIAEKIIMTYVQFFRYGYHGIFAILIAYIVFWVVKNKNKIATKDFMLIMFLVIFLNLQILSFVGVAYYSPIAGRMLIFIDTTLFLIVYKFVLIRKDFFYTGLGFRVWQKYFFYGLPMIVFACVTISYYKLHQFIILRQEIIAQNIDNQISLPQYDDSLNFFVRYIVYFDEMRTGNDNFIRMYKSNKLN